MPTHWAERMKRLETKIAEEYINAGPLERSAILARLRQMADNLEEDVRKLEERDAQTPKPAPSQH